MKDLRNKHALLTGGSRGLGPHIARALACRGVHLSLTARSADALALTAAAVAAMGVQAKPIPADLADGNDRERLLEQAIAANGPVDILVNNAGMERVSRYTTVDPDYIERMIETNLVAPLLLARLVLPGMLARGSGHVVMMSSLGGKKGSPYSATYAATKAGMIEWTSAVREEMRGTGVSASVICPGFVAGTGMFAAYGTRAPKIVGETTPEKVANAVIRAIEHDVQEIIVTPGPKRLLSITNVLSPRFTTWALRAFGVYEFYRRQADANQAGVSADDQRRPKPGDRLG